MIAITTNNSIKVNACRKEPGKGSRQLDLGAGTRIRLLEPYSSAAICQRHALEQPARAFPRSGCAACASFSSRSGPFLPIIPDKTSCRMAKVSISPPGIASWSLLLGLGAILLLPASGHAQSLAAGAVRKPVPSVSRRLSTSTNAVMVSAVKAHQTNVQLRVLRQRIFVPPAPPRR
ncbi:MAG: hypothetical protein U1G07_04340 [Verrucomicrobiota bacterium]